MRMVTLKDLEKEYKQMGTGYISLVNIHYAMTKAATDYMIGYMRGYITEYEKAIKEANSNL
jgi:hypothetical protein